MGWVRGASSGGDLKLYIRVNGSRLVEQSGGVCVPVVDVVAGRGCPLSAGFKVQQRNSTPSMDFRERPRCGRRASTFLEACLRSLYTAHGKRLTVDA